MIRIQSKYLILILLVGRLIWTSAYAQSPVANSAGNFRETVWLQAERHLWLSGETISFHAAVLEKDTYQPSVLSKNLRVELNDSTGKRILGLNLELREGQVDGTLALPTDLKTGCYALRAYTNWMRNFAEADFTAIPVRIVQPADLDMIRESAGFQKRPSTKARQRELSISLLNQSLTIKLSHPAAGVSGNIRLLAHRCGTWYWFDNKKYSDSLAFTVPVNQLPEGLVQFSLLGENGQIIARQLWRKAGELAGVVNISITPEATAIRSHLKADFQLTGKGIYEASSFLAGMVSLEEPESPLDSLIPGLPGWNCDLSIPAGKEKYPDWLNSNYYPDETVKSFFSSAAGFSQGLQFLPETRSVLLSGKVLDKKSGKPVSEAGIGVTLLATNTFQAIKTNTDGLFYFTFPDISQPADYLLTFISEPDSAWSIEVYPEFDKRPFKPDLPDFYLNRQELNYLKERNINLQLSRIYAPEEPLERPAKPAIKAEKPFYDPPDRTIYIDNYIELANVGEVVYEVVPDVQVHREGNKARLSVFSTQPSAYGYETLILLDGIPITAHKDLLDLPPGRIKSIDVRNKIYIHGNYVFASVVNFISRNGDFAGLKLPSHSLQGTLTPPQRIALKKKSVQVNEMNIPDLDQVIFRQRALNPGDGTLEFMTNDLSGRFTIRLGGFDSHGNWWMGRSEFRNGTEK